MRGVVGRGKRPGAGKSVMTGGAGRERLRTWVEGWL